MRIRTGPAGGSDLCLLLGHHVELLLAHPRLRLGGVKVVLLRPVRLLQSAVAMVRLLQQLPPQLLQVVQALPDPAGTRRLVAQEALAALQDVIDARLMTLDLLLQSLSGQTDY